MNKTKSTYFQLIKRKEFLLYTILIISSLALFGWLSGNMIFTSYSLNYIPIAPSNIILVSILIIISLLNLKFGDVRFLQIVSTILILFVVSFCLFIFIQYIFSLSYDIEKALLKNPQRFGNLSIGRMSPITSILFIFICLGMLGTKQKNLYIARYIGGGISLLVFLISSVLLIGYLYKAPLLYGSNIIPVSLPSALCFSLFSITLLRIFELKFWTFNLIKDNKITFQLLKSFLPFGIFIVLMLGFIMTNISITNYNITLTVAIITIIVVLFITYVVIKLSGNLGEKLFLTEKKLKESDTKYRIIADYNYDWEFWLTNEKKFIYNSPSCERISGYKPIDFSNNPDLITQIIYPEDLLIYETHLNINSENITCGGIDYRIITRSGEIRWINHICQLVFDENGINIGRRSSNCDITSRKIAENLIIELNSELKKMNADKDRFISILGHDLINPFNNILGLSEVLSENIHNLGIKEMEELANYINKSTKSTYALLEEILLWARTQQGQIPFKPKLLRLKDITMETFEILLPGARAKNIALNYLADENITVFGDPDMLKTVIRNLITNAIKFTNINGIINIDATRNSENVTILISDNGVGISKDTLSKLFDISKVITTSGTAKETGTGLGLLLCKDFIEKHGGRMWVESEVGKGSIFYFNVPSVVETITSNDASVLNNKKVKKEPKILIVDDEYNLRLILHEMTKSISSEILFATSGEEAVEVCRKTPDIDIIFMDYLMSGINGVETSHEIRKFNKEVIIILQTAFEVSDNLSEDHSVISDYCAKPYNKHALLQTINKYFRIELK